ncbi:non-structural maintenance of chromosomes element 3 homolog [Xenia sp. Carnegie-2017]|uniref:non-structural maintenance of chromosomes element 3 homolog n=1 Tax=Xenia sp. Carnegie-2017 TaxID=2897299 RepID=UPI001F03C6F4|nr:non-structural maintenance of chromosomes element 3 homolog [Xenia sp. Carnegie-2017]
MPNLSQRRAKTSSQPEEEGRGRKRRHNNEDTQESTQSSQASNELSKAEMEKKVTDFVRYMIFMDSKKTPVRRAELNKNVMKEHTKYFKAVFDGAKKKLRKLFGYKLIEAELNKLKVYMLVNEMQEEASQVVRNRPDDLPKLGLLMVILATIFMKDNVITDGVLWDTLKKLGINQKNVHETFGDAEKLIFEFVRQTYLDRKKIVTGDTVIYEYRWGVRAQHEITKREVLQFVSQIYGNEVDAWTAKLKEVVEQEEDAASESD